MDYGNLEVKLPSGVYRIKATYLGEVQVEEGQEMLLADAIDQSASGASLVDWEVNGD